MRAIFISYRREDSEGHAGRLFESLTDHFGKEAVFMDVAAIEPGRDFRRAIDSQIASCGVLLAVIGKDWLDAKSESGQRRLDDPSDFVRLETASALKRDIPVVPVLVHGARMPRADELPADLSELAYRNGVELTHARWESDVQVLIAALQPHVERTQTGAAEAATTQHASSHASNASADSTVGRSVRAPWAALGASVFVLTVVAGGAAVYFRAEREPKNRVGETAAAEAAARLTADKKAPAAPLAHPEADKTSPMAIHVGDSASAGMPTASEEPGTFSSWMPMQDLNALRMRQPRNARFPLAFEGRITADGRFEARARFGPMPPEKTGFYWQGGSTPEQYKMRTDELAAKGFVEYSRQIAVGPAGNRATQFVWVK